jgi:hypothetical protein
MEFSDLCKCRSKLALHVTDNYAIMRNQLSSSSQVHDATVVVLIATRICEELKLETYILEAIAAWASNNASRSDRLGKR